MPGNIPAAEFHEQGAVEERPWYSGRNPDRYLGIDATNQLDFGHFRDLIAPRGIDTRHNSDIHLPWVRHDV